MSSLFKFYLMTQLLVSIEGVGRFIVPNFQFTVPFVYVHNLLIFISCQIIEIMLSLDNLDFGSPLL